LAPASGHDFLGILIGREMPVKGGRVVTGKTWIDFRSDLYAAFSRSEGAVTRGGTSLRDYVQTLFRANVHARFAWSDAKPVLPVNLKQPPAGDRAGSSRSESVASTNRT